MNKAEVAQYKPYYLCDCNILHLFVDHNPNCPHVPIGDSIWTEEIELHEAQQSDRKHAASPFPSQIESSLSFKPNTKKKNRTLKKVAAAPAAGYPFATVATLTIDPTTTCTVDDLLLAELPVPFSWGVQAIKSSGDCLDGVTFHRSVMV